MNYTLDAYGTKQSKIKKCIITGKCPESWWSRILIGSEVGSSAEDVDGKLVIFS